MSRFDFISTQLDGLYIVQPKPICDDRGYFERFFCKEDFKSIGLEKEIVQINHSMTRCKGTVRGMHYQQRPFTEIKIIRCLKGSIYDVVIDIRKGSSTFLHWFGIELSEENGKYMYIPEGFAHGFQSLQNDTEILYLNTEYYNTNFEAGIHAKDIKININWPLDLMDISKKDESHIMLDDTFQGI